MFREKGLSALSTLGITLLLLLPYGCSPFPAKSDKLSLYVASDLHYLSPSLHDDGQAFQDYVTGGDGKMLNYSEELTDAWVAEMKAQKPKVLVLSGDLTNNGEKESHLALAAKLKQIEQSGTDVYVIPGNHDLNNPWARRFKTDGQYEAESVTVDEFTDIYKDYGYGTPLSRDTNSLSYVAKVTDKLRLLMLDSSQYRYNRTLGYPITRGDLTDGTMEWIRQNGEKAQAEGAQMIAVLHHNLIDHTEPSREGYTLDNGAEVRALFERLNIQLTLSGHIHAQSIAQSGSLYDIATGAFAVYPHPYGVIQIFPKAGTLVYDTHQVDVDAWSKKHKLENPDLTGFSSYSRNFFYARTYNKAYASLEDQPFSTADREEMAAALAELNMYYFAGAESRIPPELKQSPGALLWAKAEDSYLKTYVQDILTSQKVNDHLSLPFGME
jgi:3',5'-cyclic AMP phosphodiesterase CpdA